MCSSDLLQRSLPLLILTGVSRGKLGLRRHAGVSRGCVHRVRELEWTGRGCRSRASSSASSSVVERKGADDCGVYGTNLSWGTAGMETGAHWDGADVAVHARGSPPLSEAKIPTGGRRGRSRCVRRSPAGSSLASAAFLMRMTSRCDSRARRSLAATMAAS